MIIKCRLKLFPLAVYSYVLAILLYNFDCQRAKFMRLLVTCIPFHVVRKMRLTDQEILNRH